jgi:hypothetical protein
MYDSKYFIITEPVSYVRCMLIERRLVISVQQYHKCMGTKEI